jgi:hypothetical protein
VRGEEAKRPTPRPARAVKPRASIPRYNSAMPRLIRFAATAVLTLALVSPALAALADETLTGSLMCAKCALKKADAHECQDVLVVTDATGAKIEYYVTKNEVAEKAGEACTTEIKATVTGTVSETDGRKWITPSKIEKH